MKRSSSKSVTDYSDAFLLMILVGIVLVVLGLMMAVGRASSRVTVRPAVTNSPVKALPAMPRPPIKMQH